MIDRRGFFAFALKAAAAGAAGVLIAAPAMAQNGPNHRRRARNGAAKPQQQDTAANVAQPEAPNHRRGRQLRTRSQTSEVVADIAWDAPPRPSGPMRRR